MNFCPPLPSPSAFRNREMLSARLLSSTKLSGQMSCNRISFSNKCPGCSTSVDKRSNAFGVSGTVSPPRSNKRSARFSRNGPNSHKPFRFCLLVAPRILLERKERLQSSPLGLPGYARFAMSASTACLPSGPPHSMAKCPTRAIEPFPCSNGMTLGHSLPGANRRDGPWQPPAIRSGLVLCALVLSFRPAEGQSAACRELNRTVIEQVTNGQLGKAELALSAVPENPQDPLCTGLIMANLAAIRTMQGKYAEAETLAQRSLGVLEEHYAKDRPALLRPLHVLAASRLEQGKVAKAREAFQRMRVLRLDRPMDTALFHDIAGSLLEAEGKPWEAAPEYLAGIRALDDSGHGDTAYAGTLLQALASSYLQQERLDD